MNCLIVDDDKVTREIFSEYIKLTDGIELARACENAIAAANFLKANSVDLIFLDIEMPKMTGIEFIKALSPMPPVIFISAKDKYAIEAFEYEVIDYLVKPVSYDRFLKSITKALKTLHPNPIDSVKNETVFLKVDSELVGIKLQDILWVEAMGDYLAIITPQKKHVILSTMKDLEAKLGNKDFFRVHRSFIVRVDKIKKIVDDILLIESKPIPISKTQKKEMLDRLNLL